MDSSCCWHSNRGLLFLLSCYCRCVPYVNPPPPPYKKKNWTQKNLNKNSMKTAQESRKHCHEKLPHRQHTGLRFSPLLFIYFSYAGRPGATGPLLDAGAQARQTEALPDRWPGEERHGKKDAALPRSVGLPGVTGLAQTDRHSPYGSLGVGCLEHGSETGWGGGV